MRAFYKSYEMIPRFIMSLLTYLQSMSVVFEYQSPAVIRKETLRNISYLLNE